MTEPDQKPSDQTQCPSSGRLRRWLNGLDQLSEPDERHVQHCTVCQTVLAALADDESLLPLASSFVRHEQTSFATEREYLQLKATLEQHPELSGSPDARASLPAMSADKLETHRSSDSPQASTQPSVHATDAAAAPQSWDLERLSACLPQGRFVVKRLIASGGAGMVYQAYDTRLSRDVAIKLLARNSYRDRARFMREARLLAELIHPNIVRIFESGMLGRVNSNQATSDNSDDQLYLVMEYIGGGTAVVLQPDTDRQPQSQTDYVRLANLLAGACRGVQAAHDKQLVHRDIKPGNLLLSDDLSTLKVGDFGLARLSHEAATQVTRTGDVLGTPAFMSPEQFAGDDQVQASSDIYSMGATLYQLLVGWPPYQGNTAAIARQVLDSEPVAPRLVNPQIPPALEIICLRAMAKEPARRYGSMTALADDLQRFAVGEPIQARPVSATTKAWYFLRRNPSLATAVMTSVLLAILLIAGSLTAAIVFRQNNLELVKAAAAEATAKQSAQQSRQQAIDAANQLLVAVTEDAELLPRAPGSEEVSKKLLNRAQAYYTQLINTQKLANEPDDSLDFDIARAHAGLARVAHSLGDHATVEQESKLALDLLENLPPTAVDELARVILMCRTLNVLGKSYVQREDFKMAVATLSRSQTLSQAELEQSPNDQELVYLLAESLRGRAMSDNASGQIDSAEQALTQAISLMSISPALAGGDPQFLRLAAAIETTLAVTLLRREGFEVAKEHLERAMRTLEPLKVNGFLPVRLRRDNATNMINLAMAEGHLRNFDRAEQLFNQAEEEYRQLSLLEPNVTDHKMSQAVTILNSGRVYVAKNDIETIRRKYKVAEALVTELLANDPDSANNLGTLGMIQSNLAIFSQMQGKPEEAVQPLIDATDTLLRYAKLVENTPDSLHAIALNYYELSKCYFDMARYTDAEEALAASMRYTREVLTQEADYLDSLCHQVDEWALQAELAAASETVDAQSAMRLAREAVNRSEALLRLHPELPEYKVRHGSVLATVAEAHLKAQEPQAAQERAEAAIEYVRALAEAPFDETASDALAGNYDVLVRALSAQLESLHLDSEDPAIVQRISSIKQQLEAAQKELAALQQ